MQWLERAKHAYLIGSIPLYALPVYWLYCSVGFLLWYVYFGVVRRTCRFEFVGQDPRSRTGGYVLTLWHENAWNFIAFCTPLKKHVMMNHPYWYMRPIHLILEEAGAELSLGSSSVGGRIAADQVVQKLKEGWNTLMMPDGPDGPLYVLKKGVLHMALQSGCPLIPVWFSMSRAWRGRGWDRKYFPMPFSRVRVHFGDPVTVTTENFDRLAGAPRAWLPISGPLGET